MITFAPSPCWPHTQTAALRSLCLVEHHHSRETIVGLIRAGLASLQTKHLGKPVNTERVKITAKGRLALRMPRAKIETRDEAVNAALRAYPHLTYEEAEKITTAFGF